MSTELEEPSFPAPPAPPFVQWAVARSGSFQRLNRGHVTEWYEKKIWLSMASSKNQLSTLANN